VPTFIDLGTVDGKLVGVFIKATLKGLIWYNPKVFTVGEPTTWQDLQIAAGRSRRPGQSIWCNGLESAATSGWPGTDWVEDILLRESGPDVYDDWVAGRLTWTSPEIKSAFQRYGEVASNSFGGSTAVITTKFEDSGNGLFTDPPECLFLHQATFMTQFFKSEAGARDGEYDFFPMPDMNPQFAGSVTGGGDLFGMFNDTPQARALMRYLVTPEAQEIWVQRGGALSVNTSVTNYPDEISKRAALVLSNASQFRFDASDLMPEQMSAAFTQAMVDYTRDPSSLDNILAHLDDVQRLVNASNAPVRP
jgi:alpha-glucoside transport system substrate-binding protein